MAAIITLNITAALNISSRNNVSTVTIKALGGSVTILGSGPYIDYTANVTYPASNITLVDGSSVTLNSPSPSPIDSLIITPAANAEVILQS